MRSLIPTNPYRMIILGALNGLAYGEVLIFYTRQVFEYNVRLTNEEFERLGTSPPDLLYMLKDRAVILGFVLFFTVASCVIVRYWPRRWHSSLLFWQTIGLAAVASWQLVKWGLLWLDAVLAGSHVTGGTGYDIAYAPNAPLSIPVTLACAVMVNLIFAGMVNLGMTAASAFKTPELR